MACNHKDTCAMFPLISLNSALQIWQTFYCDTKHENCQRYQRSSAGEAVAINLLPNGKELDLNLIDVKQMPAAKPATPVAQPAPAPAPAAAPPPSLSTSRPATQPSISSGGGALFSYYLRVRLQDVPGLAEKVLNAITEVGIGVDASITKPPMADGTRCLIVITDQGPEVDLYRAIMRIEKLEGVASKVKSISLEKMDALQAA